MPKIFQRAILILTILAGFFCLANFALAAEPFSVVVSEIAWMGTAVSANDEWIELYNNTDANIDLTGWTLKAIDGQPEITLTGAIAAKSYFLLERTSDETLTTISADQIYTGALGNVGEKLELRDASNNLIDTIDCSSGWFSGDNTTKATMERINLSQEAVASNWATSHNAGGTPKAQNSVFENPPAPEPIPEPTPPLTPQPPSSEGSSATPSYFSGGDLVINEIMSAPVKDQAEWLEFYKKINSEIDLSGWTIEEGSGSVTTLSGKILQDQKYYLTENLKGRLNNEGDIIILKWNGKIIDKVSYGDWNDGELRDNAPAPEAPNSLARIINGQDTDNDLADFAATQVVTKGSANQISNPDNEEENKIANYPDYSNYSNLISINEILPNPMGDDSESEFIELKNQSQQAIDLVGWKIGDASQNLYVISNKDFESTMIAAQGYLVLWRKLSQIALNNNGDEVKLYQPNGQLADSLIYSQSVKDDVAYAKDKNGLWQWTTKATPGKENEIILLVQSPQAVISAPAQAEIGQEIVFDGSDSFDPQKGALSYLWFFSTSATSSDKVAKCAFSLPGKYQIKLTVTNTQKLSDSCDWQIEIKDKSNQISLPSAHPANLKLSEFLPDPAGSDEAEFIEIYNASQGNANLKGWSLDDEEGGSRPYQFNQDLVINPSGYLVIEKKESNISLNNDGDQVRLFNPEKGLIDEISYEPAPEAASYSLSQDGNWYWTPTITPGKANIIDANFATEFAAGESMSYLEISLAEINNLEIGDEVTTQGVASVAPGVLGKQIFYLSGSGIQVYMFKADFPEIKEGDLVKVSGVISEAAGERRIKIKNKEDIVILEHREPPTPQELAIAEVGEEKIGELIKVTGDLTQKTSSGFYLDDGNEEIYVYIKQATGIIKKELIEGDRLEVSGIVSMTKSGLRLLPRYQDDIKKIGQVLGASTEADIINNISQNSGSKIVKYLIATIGALILIIVSLGYKILQTKKVANQ